MAFRKEQSLQMDLCGQCIAAAHSSALIDEKKKGRAIVDVKDHRSSQYTHSLPVTPRTRSSNKIPRRHPSRTALRTR